MNKRNILLTCILLTSILFLGACATFNKAAYVASETAFQLYSASMTTLANLADQGTITENQWQTYGVEWGGKVQAFGIAFDTAMIDYIKIKSAVEAYTEGEPGTVTLADGTVVEVSESSLSNYYGLALEAGGVLLKSATSYVNLLKELFDLDLYEELATLTEAIEEAL